MTLTPLAPDESLNYIGLFLTLECNLNCSYCINDPEQLGQRKLLFPIESKSARKSLSPQEWSSALNRLPFRADLPITLQGGEPMLYWGGKGLGMILPEVPHYFDLLTNFALKPEVFVRNLNGQQARFQRPAPYPSIRVSYHADEMNRTWDGRGFEELVERCLALGSLGFDVCADKAHSDVGIYMVEHPQNAITPAMKAACEGRLPFEGKEFLGVEGDELHGHYLYPHSTDLVARGIHPTTLSCECRTTELLIDPMGFVWGCHFYLYESWRRGGLTDAFAQMHAAGYRYKSIGANLFHGKPLAPIGHILDPEFSMADLADYRVCNHYGRCIGCDTKIKNNRFQSYYDQGLPHTSVQIRNIRLPAHLAARLEHPERSRQFLHPATLKELQHATA